MPLIQCPDCKKEISDAAPSCPNCGRPNVVDMTKQHTSQLISEPRKVSIPLIVGIIMIPFISSWFTLRKGYSTTARVVSLSWMVLAIVIGLSGESENKQTSTSSEPSATASVETTDVSSTATQANNPSEASPVEDKAEQPKKEITNVTFNLTPTQFQKKFNTASKKLDDNLAISNIDVGSGDVNNSFKHMFNNNTGLVGTVDKRTGKIMSFMFLFSGSQDQQEILHAVSVPLFISQIVNPEQDKEKLSKIILNMISKSMDAIDSGESITHKIGNVEYSSSTTKYTGLMLAIEPIKP